MIWTFFLWSNPVQECDFVCNCSPRFFDLRNKIEIDRKDHGTHINWEEETIVLILYSSRWYGMMLYVPVVPFLYLAMCSVAVHRFGKIFGGNNQLIRRVEFLTFVNYCIWQVNTAIACHRISMYNVYTVQMIVQLFFPPFSVLTAAFL